ncbi:zincin-like metallopeptidase domain-containing protein (plasmid) [Methylomarinum sp. Ch1-1]|uniref:Zincin-like metallopeptidase domain-containing protein n=1 Tax=Methylomarinum roseum TaxID=3067653 RepID=A0AAU7P0M4_9GAMM|nr:zincin-like metallopeptidase domain-containing protein [Methylomarinum sp. Ch1-1]MDP4519009.1 zincin-like metallopeptidase domain-containing protein [Methylomarinum sp. Ch1-1]MDP4523408.1 zincin-like metallopeptidase domain-containing protein [Methylomarinum sp. Ch1-1]
MAEKQKHNSTFQVVTDTILASLEEGVAPWVKPWNSNGLGLPANGKTKKTYQGINQILLSMAQVSGEFSSSKWLSFKQAVDLGGSVKGQKSQAFVVFYKRRAKFEGQWLSAKKESELIAEGMGSQIERIPFLTKTPVFNLDQVSGLPESFFEEEQASLEKTREFESPGIYEAVIQLMRQNNVKLLRNQDKAAYSPLRDIIIMPPIQSFITKEDFCSTLLHEIGHWTGHQDRLDRDLSGKFGDEKYAFEELVAEISSAMMCAQLNIDGFLQHAEYIASWIDVLKNDNRAFFKAVKQAQDASEYLLNNAKPEFEQDQGQDQGQEEYEEVSALPMAS